RIDVVMRFAALAYVEESSAGPLLHVNVNGTRILFILDECQPVALVETGTFLGRQVMAGAGSRGLVRLTEGLDKDGTGFRSRDIPIGTDFDRLKLALHPTKRLRSCWA